VRRFAYGAVAVILFLYLKELGLGEGSIGLLFTCTLVGDLVLSLLLTSAADIVGRKKVLIFGDAFAANVVC